MEDRTYDARVGAEDNDDHPKDREQIGRRLESTDGLCPHLVSDKARKGRDRDRAESA